MIDQLLHQTTAFIVIARNISRAIVLNAANLHHAVVDKVEAEPLQAELFHGILFVLNVNRRDIGQILAQIRSHIVGLIVIDLIVSFYQ